METRDLFFFDKMIVPKIIVVVYWLGLAGCVIGGLITMFGNFMIGLLVLVFGSVAVRIWCELLIVMFKINEALQDIRTK